MHVHIHDRCVAQRISTHIECDHATAVVVERVKYICGVWTSLCIPLTSQIYETNSPTASREEVSEDVLELFQRDNTFGTSGLERAVVLGG
jgi:hypothetical protein